MSTVSQIGAAETAKYLMDIPSCVIQTVLIRYIRIYLQVMKI